MTAVRRALLALVVMAGALLTHPGAGVAATRPCHPASWISLTHPPGCADHITHWRVRHGDTLWAIAGHVYSAPLCWRMVARFNGVADVRRLHAGQLLLLPDYCSSR